MGVDGEPPLLGGTGEGNSLRCELKRSQTGDLHRTVVRVIMFPSSRATGATVLSHATLTLRFHRPAAFYAEEGDILMFPSFAIHKVGCFWQALAIFIARPCWEVPPHIGQGTRVVFPSNCHLPKRRRKLSDKHKAGWGMKLMLL